MIKVGDLVKLNTAGCRKFGESDWYGNSLPDEHRTTGIILKTPLDYNEDFPDLHHTNRDLLYEIRWMEGHYTYAGGHSGYERKFFKLFAKGSE